MGWDGILFKTYGLHIVVSGIKIFFWTKIVSGTLAEVH
jgi:hypothetical protein